MVMPNPERIGRALELLRDGLKPECERAYRTKYGDDWIKKASDPYDDPKSVQSPDDVAWLLSSILTTWESSWRQRFNNSTRSLVFEVKEVRNGWAHQNTFSSDDTIRALDSMERLLEAFGNREQRKKIQESRYDLRRQVVEEESRAQRRKVAAKPTEGKPQAGLTPWRDVISPHTDVASGRFDQAEFAADLYEVVEGSAGEEYQDPKAFFNRTYLTKGLQDLLTGATRRLSGRGDDPIIELQTNFGGGKTHSLIALYHLASGVPAGDLPGVGAVLADANLVLPTKISRAALACQMLSPSDPKRVEDDVELHTLWGHLAYQLGGRDGYEIVRVDDEKGTNPGATLKTLFERFGPAVIMIDEWVSYARQLRDGADRLAGGDFDTQFTFAQALTETAAACSNIVVLISIPSSSIEVGGDRGQDALIRLKNVVTRKAKQWQPAEPDESFEIVRRRLFDPIESDRVKLRDGVVGAFWDMYKAKPGTFPSDTDTVDYRRRMELSYPIHPELFDRLFGDWSAIDKFQRTRGVLRFMALAISELWKREDRSLLIMPGTLPMDSSQLASETKKYLEDGWDPVIKSDVDGENARPLRIDRSDNRFGQFSATRRAARTVYMGSAPRADGKRGVDIKSVVLGCTQPGEPSDRFGEALKQLAREATHLYIDGAQYWYSLQANITRTAAELAESTYTDFDADDYVKDVLTKERDRGGFNAVQVFPEGPGDVPDDNDGVRLVILTPDATHQNNATDSEAVLCADTVLGQYKSGPRLNRNMLVFVAADQARLTELRQVARSHLAWKSICDHPDPDKYNLTNQQRRHAQANVDETAETVTSRIRETFKYVLVPGQQRGTSEVTWTTISTTAQGSIPERVTQKLNSEEQLISTYGGVRIRMDIDQNNLWSDRHDIEVRSLWETYCRFLYMPRLADRNVLYGAISDGTSNLNWEQETFAYGEGYVDDGHVGVRAGEQVTASPSGFLIHPDHAPPIGIDPPKQPTVTPGVETHTQGQNSATGGETVATKAYAHFELDSVRAVKHFGDIVANVVGRLGPDVTFSLEIEGHKESGYDDNDRRIVTENAKNLDGIADFE